MPEDVSQFGGISVLQKEDGFEVWEERNQSKKNIKQSSIIQQANSEIEMFST